MATFAIGDRVKWNSSNTDKVGEIVAVVPAGQRPIDVGFAKAGGGGLSRDHTTYIVKGRKLDSRGDPRGSTAHYWPVVSLLRPHA